MLSLTGTNHLGFELYNSHFYINTSNSQETARLGGDNDGQYLRLYNRNQIDYSYVIGVTRSPPVLSIGKVDACCTDDRIIISPETTRVGIGNTNPQYTLDVTGDINLTGNLIYPGSNIVVNTTIYELSKVSASNQAASLDFNDTSINDVFSIETKHLRVENIFNDTALYVNAYGCTTANAVEIWRQRPNQGSNAAFVVDPNGNVGINQLYPINTLQVTGGITVDNNPITVRLGNMQRITAASGQIFIGNNTPTKIGFRISWTNTIPYVTQFQMFEVSITCMLTGNNIRLHHAYELLIDPTFPALDTIVHEKRLISPKTIDDSKIIVYGVAGNTLTGANTFVDVVYDYKFASFVNQSYMANCKIEVFCPFILGVVDIIGITNNNAIISDTTQTLGNTSSNISIVVDSNGNVGIGTIYPINTLHVNGSMVVDNNPIVHRMGNTQQVFMMYGQIMINTLDSHSIGFNISWQNSVNMFNIFEAKITYMLLGNEIRTHHSAELLINPFTKTLDNISDEHRMLSRTMFSSKIMVTDGGNNNSAGSAGGVNVFYDYAFNQSKVNVFKGYAIDTKIEVFTPISLGTITITNIFV